MSKSHLDRKRNASWKHNWNRAPHYITRWMKTRQVKCEELYHCQNVLHINIAYLSNNFSSKFCIITFRYTDLAPTTSCSSHSHQKRFRKEHSCVFVGAFGLVAPDHPTPNPLKLLSISSTSLTRISCELCCSCGTDAWRLAEPILEEHGGMISHTCHGSMGLHIPSFASFGQWNLEKVASSSRRTFSTTFRKALVGGLLDSLESHHFLRVTKNFEVCFLEIISYRISIELKVPCDPHELISNKLFRLPKKG